MHFVGSCRALLHTSFVALSFVTRQCLHHSSLVSRAVGAFFISTLSTYTKLSTLIDWLWMWVVGAARQCVCDSQRHQYSNLSRSALSSIRFASAMYPCSICLKISATFGYLCLKSSASFLK